jgi:GTP cyclohydrolase II
MPVSSRIPHVVGRGEDNRRYLETKRVRSGHLLDGDEPMRRVA